MNSRSDALRPDRPRAMRTTAQRSAPSRIISRRNGRIQPYENIPALQQAKQIAPSHHTLLRIRLRHNGRKRQGTVLQVSRQQGYLLHRRIQQPTLHRITLRRRDAHSHRAVPQLVSNGSRNLSTGIRRNRKHTFSTDGNQP